METRKMPIDEGKREIIDKYGEWTAHNIQLGGDIYTIDKRIVGDEIRLKRVVQMVSDIANKPLKDLRILDLGCLEGLYAIEFARRGAEVVGIEGRKANIEKARFAKQALSLNSLEFFQDDVRNLSKKKYGQFDVVLCLNLLSHLNVPDVFSFMERLAEVCRGIAIIITDISITAKKPYIYNGKKYWGRTFLEHYSNSTSEERAKSLWASLDNLTSFWFTRSSLYNLLSDVGFTSIYECHIPLELEKRRDVVTLLAVKGEDEALMSSPMVNELPKDRYPEKRQTSLHLTQRWYYNIFKRPYRLLPKQIKEILKNRQW